MAGVAPPPGCVKITILNPPPQQTMEVTITPDGLGYPPGVVMDRVESENPEVGTYYRNPLTGDVWVFLPGGQSSGTWHDFGNPQRMGTWGPC